MAERVRVNPIACEAHGMCAELLPERITLDEWGYPIIDGAPLQDWQVEHAICAARACDERPLSGEMVAHAQRAAQARPTFALLVERERAR